MRDIIFPPKPSSKCFAGRNELMAAVNRYVQSGCGEAATLCSRDSEMYGWLIGSWLLGSPTWASPCKAVGPVLDTSQDQHHANHAMLFYLIYLLSLKNVKQPTYLNWLEPSSQ